MNIEFYFGHLNILKRSEQEVVHSIFFFIYRIRTFLFLSLIQNS